MSRLLSHHSWKSSFPQHSCKSLYSTESNTSLSFSKLQIIQNKKVKALTPLNQLVFGQSFTDHMLTIPWSATQGKSFFFAYKNDKKGCFTVVFFHMHRLDCSSDSSLRVSFIRPEFRSISLRFIVF